MKKIKNINHLYAEKKRLQKQEEYLEKKISSSWTELKQTLKPVVIVKDALYNILNEKTKENLIDDSILKSSLIYGISLLAKILADKAEEKISSYLKK